MNIGFVMDPLDGVNKDKDTSYILMLAALQKGHRVFHIDQDHIQLQGHLLKSWVTELKLPFDSQPPLQMDLAQCDVIWVRKDPPFDRRYFYTTLLLDFLPNSTRVINRPQALRDWNEKLSALRYPDWTPKTLISNENSQILQFVEENKTAILKPIDGFGGKGIVRVSACDDNLEKAIEEATQNGCHKIVVNEYIQEAEIGDKRILIVGGKPIGAILRVALKKGQLNNLDQGGVAQPVELTRFDIELCRRLGQDFLDHGLYFVGIDLLGEKLTEINVTSPTGLQELIRFSGVPHHFHIIRDLEPGL